MADDDDHDIDGDDCFAEQAKKTPRSSLSLSLSSHNQKRNGHQK